jgi:phage shock protein A
LSGNRAEVDKLDQLAKIALKRKMSFNDQVKAYSVQVAEQTVLREKLKTGFNSMSTRREELAQRRAELAARPKMASAQVKVPEAVQSISIQDPSATSTASKTASGGRKRRLGASSKSSAPRSKTN